MTMYYRKPSLADQEIIRQEIVDFSSNPVNSIQDIQDFVTAKNVGMVIYIGKFDNGEYKQAVINNYYDNMLSLVDWLRGGVIVDDSGLIVKFSDFIKFAFVEDGDINKPGITTALINVGNLNYPSYDKELIIIDGDK
jgi:hypothetical protein